MRLFSEEAKNKSDQLIFTSPMSISQIVLGKYFAALFLFFIALLITIVFPIALSFFGNIPSAQIIGTYIGHLILAACFISVGLFISSLSENQIVVAISSFATIFLFFILDSITTTLPTNKIASSIFILALIFALSLYVFRQTKDRVMSVVCFIVFILGLILSFIFNLNILDSTMYKVLGWFSLLSRFNNFGNGVLSVSDIIYYFSFIILFLYLTINKLECRRY
jgi:ABC-2 type transport system permease protein